MHLSEMILVTSDIELLKGHRSTGLGEAFDDRYLLQVDHSQVSREQLRDGSVAVAKLLDRDIASLEQC